MSVDKCIRELVLIFATSVNKIGHRECCQCVTPSYRKATAQEKKKFSAGKVKLITDSKKGRNQRQCHKLYGSFYPEL